jgi:hypothetical protein
MQLGFGLVVTALLLTSSFHGPFHASGTVASLAAPNIAVQGTSLSVNWSGYVAADDLATPDSGVTHVHGCWTVPTINKPPSAADSVAFVGIGGAASGDTTLIQAGTRHEIRHGVPSYSIWYELLPDPLTTTNVSVLAGDEVCVTIQRINVNPETWAITIDNLNTEASPDLNQEFIYASSKKTAEWIVERPSSCVSPHFGVRCRFVNPADFGSITFTDAHATIGGVIYTIFGAPDFDDITMLSGLKVLAAVTEPVDSSNQNAFTVTYKP